MRIRGSDDHHFLRHQRIAVDGLAVETAYQSADLQFEVEPLRKVVVTRTSTSRLERASGASRRRYEPGELFMMSEPDGPYTARWRPGEIQLCVIDPALLARVAATAPGPHPAPIRFTGLDPRTPAAAARWWDTRSYVAGLLASPEATAAQLLVASAAQLLAAVTLATFPNTAVTDPAAADRNDAHPATLRRAVDYIDEHAHTDITIAEIAAAAHVSVRAIQLAFRRHLDTTPLRYLRWVRLEHAHRDLVAADPALHSITTIAYRWGFSSSSRFSVLYRQTYGVSPSHTLHHN